MQVGDSADDAAAGEQGASSLAGLAVPLIAGCFSLCVGMCFLAAFIGVKVLICWFLSKIIKRIPEHHRQVADWHPYLLLIPVFNLVWAFMVYPRISSSLRSAFAEAGDYSVGDCGETLAWIYCIGVILFWIPTFGQLCVLCAFVCWILLLIQLNDLSHRVQFAAGYGAEAGYAGGYGAPPPQGYQMHGGPQNPPAQGGYAQQPQKPQHQAHQQGGDQVYY